MNREKILNFEKECFHSHLIWMFPLAFFFHVIEESMGFNQWVQKTLKGEIGIRAFYINNSVFMIVLLTLCFLAFYKRNRFTIFLLFLWVSGQQFWNFFFHIYTQYRFHEYFPGD